jgi:hypothetical protein
MKKGLSRQEERDTVEFQMVNECKNSFFQGETISVNDGRPCVK